MPSRLAISARGSAVISHGLGSAPMANATSGDSPGTAACPSGHRRASASRLDRANDPIPFVACHRFDRWHQPDVHCSERLGRHEKHICLLQVLHLKLGIGSKQLILYGDFLSSPSEPANESASKLEL